jgi:hypothetical protein
MSKQPVESRIARDLVNRYGRLPADAGVRHGSEEVAKSCRCEVCRRAFPDKKKRDALGVKARRTNACARGAAKGHPACRGWKFPPGVNYQTGNYRGAAPCQCPCHEDGRGQPVPTFDEFLELERAQKESYLAARPVSASGGAE